VGTVIFACISALMTTGLTVTYLTTKVPNFAYGTLVAVGVYTAYTAERLGVFDPYTALPVAFLLSGLTAVAMYMAVLRPLTRRGASLVSKMIATLAIDVVFVGIFGIYTGYLITRYGLIDAKSFYQLGGDGCFFGTVTSFGTCTGVRGLFVITPLAVAGLAAFLYYVLNRTKFGIAMRASIENPNLARILGINVERVYLFSWFIAGGLAGMAGPFYAMNLGGSDDVGTSIIVSIFASAVVGGLSSVFGAMVGGLIVGGGTILITSLGIKYIAGWFGSLQPGIPLAIMIIALLFFPKGLVAVDWKRLLGSRKTRG